MLDSTPMPQLPSKRNGVLETGNVLTLRDQEAKLDQIQKDNFGLKLKIHYLEDAMRKSGSEFQQQTLQENQAMEQRQEDVRQLERELESARMASKGGVEDAERRFALIKKQLQAEFDEEKDALDAEIELLDKHFVEVEAEKARLNSRIQDLEVEISQARLAKSEGTPVRERNDLRAQLRKSETERNTLESTIRKLRIDLKTAETTKTNLSPVRDREDLRRQLAEAHSKISRLEQKVESLEAELQYAEQEKTLAEERGELHDLLKKSKIEAEQLQIELTKRDRADKSQKRRESELQAQLQDAQAEIEDLQVQIADLENRTQAQTSKEREHRNNIKELKRAKQELEDLQLQLQDRNGSSSGHARREAELRAQLRDAQSEVDQLQMDLQEREAQIQSAASKERQLRERLQRARAEDTANFHAQNNNQGDLEDAELEIRTLQSHLQDRAAKLSASMKREESLKAKLQAAKASAKQAQYSAEHSQDLVRAQDNSSALTKRHQSELKGLVKQIQFLRASLHREMQFRADLIHTKNYFLLQVSMYNACNKEDLRLLEEIGVTPDMSFREKKRSLRSVGLMVVAGVRMKMGAEKWKEQKRVEEVLLKKLEGVRKGRKQVEAK
ncbi:uncharacterized protein SEPMUDRAFT_93270 [Sphaerulina musiva SO2202]|uniref:Centrosomin N-terminal motif 1 domain-containing protein n=1 Tax=Sphaerulina musiva (strain SO2202) TaxID=692275 RepID=M3ATZ8_SPHMS|nr:uncharacterized protein SEPMUDRAFT_93270 [Sphaerulina musiva SO2202]EMF08949.1 hypothetical protein SEPMUDRAFT_93270 [Sphaerulina musiva SO2202]